MNGGDGWKRRDRWLKPADRMAYGAGVETRVKGEWVVVVVASAALEVESENLG